MSIPESRQTRPIGGQLEIVRAAWDAYIAGDIDGVLAHMDPAVETDLTNFEGWPEDGIYPGHAGFSRFIHEWLAPFDHYEAGLDELVEMGPNCVLALSWQRASGAGSHVPVEMQLAQITTLQHDKIVRLELWSDRDAARAAASRR